jgi:selenocysteine-specific elongation factor
MSQFQATSFILATAGHVDHGKSALVRALTGTDPDRLPEEKARGITIDLGFAALTLAAPAGASGSHYQLGIIDVPGHEDFVKNMVAGVGSIDVAILIVAADDGWMPQTEEHLQILTYLDVRHAVIALTKSDLAGDIDASVGAVRERLSGTAFADSPIVPTSVITGAGLDELKIQLARVLSQTPPPMDIGKPRLPVDRVFTLKGIGTIVTGTLTGGTLRRGQTVVAQPASRPTHIRTIQTHNREVDVAVQGSRVALNLPDLRPADGRANRTPDTVARGDVITLAEFGKPSRAVDVLIERSGRTISPDARPRPLKNGASVHVHHGSGSFAARVILLDADVLAAGEKSLARLSAEEPVFAFVGDRFVIRDWPEQHTLAGGVVLDADPSSGSARREKQRMLLEARSQSPFDASAYVASQLKLDGFANAGLLLLKSRFSRGDIGEAIKRLGDAKQIVVESELVADQAQWSALKTRAIETIDGYHQNHPEHVGLPLVELRKALHSSAAFDAMVANLSRDGFVRAGAAIRRVAHRPSLPPKLSGAGARLRGALAARPFDPPSRKELAPDDVSFGALKFLLSTGEAVEISSEIVLGAEAYDHAIALIRGHLKIHQAATVSELKTLLNSSRRIMVPLLEYLDKQGITRREGDKRRLGS